MRAASHSDSPEDGLTLRFNDDDDERKRAREFNKIQIRVCVEDAQKH